MADRSFSKKLGQWLNLSVGVSSPASLLSWAVAGGLGYYWFVLPDQRSRQAHQVRIDDALKRYEEKGRWIGTSEAARMAEEEAALSKSKTPAVSVSK